LKTITRTLLNLLGWLSLILFFAVVALWYRSYRTRDFFGRMTFIDRREGPSFSTVGIVSGQGGNGYGNSHRQFPPGAKVHEWWPASWAFWLKYDGKLRWRAHRK